jgi:hypothetical protein
LIGIDLFDRSLVTSPLLPYLRNRAAANPF